MRGSRVAVIGGSGFIGRHLVRRLAQAGATVIVGVRDPEAALFLKPMGDVGQITPLYVNIGKPETIARALTDADAVVNLTGVLHQGGQSFESVHVTGAANIAEAAAAAGVHRLVHMSAIGADADSQAAYAVTKAAGEKAVLAAVPTATVLRPSVVFGPEDDFLNRFAAMLRLAPVLPLIGGGRTQFQPVYVGDVADAVMAALNMDQAQGQIFELGGPRTMSFREIMDFIRNTVGRPALLAPIPAPIAKMIGLVAQILPAPPLTRDQVLLLQYDNIVHPDAKGFAELGIVEPADMAMTAPGWLARFRKPGRSPGAAAS